MLSYHKTTSPRNKEKALKELRQIDELILPADKGNATILMMREDYDTKMKDC